MDEYIKEFKEICESYGYTQTQLDEDSKLIDFARGLGSKSKMLRTVTLGKPHYPLNVFSNSPTLSSLDLKGRMTINRKTGGIVIHTINSGH